MAAKTAPKKVTPKANTTVLPQKKPAAQTTLVDWAKKSPANNGKNKPKPQSTPNGNIMAFFKKAEDINNRIFLQERGANPTVVLDEVEDDVGWSDETANGVMISEIGEERYNENGGSNKKRKLSEEAEESVPPPACSPPPPDVESTALENLAPDVAVQIKPRKRSGPFVDDSESEDDEADSAITRRGTIKPESNEQSPVSKPLEEPRFLDDTDDPITRAPLFLKTELTLQIGGEDDEDFEGIEDDDLLEGEEYDERRWMRAQQKLEMEEAGFEGDPDDFDAPDMFPNHAADKSDPGSIDTNVPSCPICCGSLPGLSEQEVSVHVNACLDGKPLPLPKAKAEVGVQAERTQMTTSNAKAFKRPDRPAKPGQANPFQAVAGSSGPTSAFSKLMPRRRRCMGFGSRREQRSARKASLPAHLSVLQDYAGLLHRR
jgi:DNA cross-link repair 1A protein